MDDARHFPGGRPTRRRFLQITAAGLAAVGPLAAGCQPRSSADLASPATQPPAATGSAAAIPLNVSWMPGFTSAYTLQSARLLDGAGLQPNWIRFNAGPPHYAAIQGGSSDIGVIGVPPTLGALSQGIKMSIIAVEDDWAEGEGLIVRPDSGIARAADLDGRKVATLKGTNAHYALYAALHQANLDPGRVDITFLDPQALVPAFKNRAVDAAWVYTPFLYLVQEAGGRIVQTNAELHIHALGVWVSRPDYLRGNREAALRFFRALDQRVAARQQQAADIKRLMAETLSLSAELTDKAFEVDRPVALEDQLKPDHALSMVAGPGQGLRRFLKDMADFMVDQQIIDKAPDVDAAVDETPLKAYAQARATR